MAAWRPCARGALVVDGVAAVAGHLHPDGLRFPLPTRSLPRHRQVEVEREALARVVRPMNAVSVETLDVNDPALLYERKYDGVRALLHVPSRGSGAVRIWSREGHEKTRQFPELASACESALRRRTGLVVLDGEIVALDPRGEPLGFAALQPRINLERVSAHDISQVPVGFVAFDLLIENDVDLRARPLVERRARLLDLVSNPGASLRVAAGLAGAGASLVAQGRRDGWEGIVAKRLQSPYRSGRDHRDWKKLKFLLRQEFVVGGWTESESRPFRALLLGVYDAGRLLYVGRLGRGYSDADQRAIQLRLQALQAGRCPFVTRPEPDAPPHWTKPQLVVEASFSEWTSGGKLREPTYIGVRDDVDPRAVVREAAVTLKAERRLPATNKSAHAGRRARPPDDADGTYDLEDVARQLDEIEGRDAAGRLHLPGGEVLDVDGLDRVMWPALRATKGDLMRYYVAVAPYVLPYLLDRPMSWRPFPRGIDHPSRFHQRVKWATPSSVRVDVFPAKGKDFERRFVGGSLATLLYMVQHHVISMDPWLSRVQSPDEPDFAVMDLDPMPGVPFALVREVACRVHELLDQSRVPHVVKTSGLTGLHVYVPLAPGADYPTARLFTTVVAEQIVRAHPRLATTSRARADRGRRIYIDCDQNMRAKTIAAPYSVRHSSFAGVSAPVTWGEVEQGIEPEDFTMATIQERLASHADPWAILSTRRGVDIRGLVG